MLVKWHVSSLSKLRSQLVPMQSLLPALKVKGSKGRFLERAETREAGANPYPRALRPKDLPFSPQPEANWRALYGGIAARMQGTLFPLRQKGLRQRRSSLQHLGIFGRIDIAACQDN